MMAMHQLSYGSIAKVISIVFRSCKICLNSMTYEDHDF